jgi:hypothetical protein
LTAAAACIEFTLYTEVEEDPMRKLVPILAVLCALVLGCATSPQTVRMESWEHEIQAAEFTEMTTSDGARYLLYKYVDDRFNTTDWFSVWWEDWWDHSGGWTRLDAVYEPNLGLVLYQPMYHDGYMTMYAFPASLDLNVGVKARIYHLKVQ